ncbi:3997_t:CDS:2 [Gigaspora margarita]|uniref:3997_t:CDS:1 n=1 Tax=Gigaspora margarita TaxID=4874 RepID=A0ABN7UX48_GIGMA|nr:3997_t:CDS:2 [Gigaspora margarita]
MCNFEKTSVLEHDKYAFTMDTHTKSHSLIPQTTMHKSPYFRRDSNDSTTSVDRIYQSSMRRLARINLNSEKEQSRLEMQYCIFNILWKNSFSSPIENRLKDGGACVLIVGTNPSIRTFDMAHTYPRSTFIGLEISSHSSNITSSSTLAELPNATILHAHSLGYIPFPDETFDFVLCENGRVLKVGGWIEIMVIENCLGNCGPITQDLVGAYFEFIGENFESDLNVKRLEELIISSKQVESVLYESKNTLLGVNGGRIGELLTDTILHPISHNKIELSKFMNISLPDIEEMRNASYKEIDDCRSFCKSFRLFSQKI